MARALFAGTTDYSHQSFEDMLEDLRELVKELEEVYKVLDSSLKQLEENNYWETVDFDVQAVFGYSLKFYETSLEEIREILDGVQNKVERNHVARLRTLARTAIKLNRRFGQAWHQYPWEVAKQKQYGKPNFKILEGMYEVGRDMAVGMLDLGNLANRLNDFVGRGSRTALIHQSLKKCIEDFADYIRSEKRMTFWQHRQTKNGYKWITHPEKHAKDLLHTFLSGRFGDSIFTLEEIAAGAGRIDVFIISPTKKKAVIELKMCGHGYSATYAQEGIEQLTHYMENKRTKIGYLIVFDSRARDFSQGFQDTKTANGVTTTTIVADVRPYVKQKSVPNST
jgi:hypothetical protein